MSSGKSSPAILRCTDLSKSFDGVQALDSVTFDVPHEGVSGLIGPNGAGKTTLFNCISGFMEVDSGEVWFRGRRINSMAPHEIARAGLVRTFQSVRMFPDLTVLESMLLAQYVQKHRGKGIAAWELRIIRQKGSGIEEVEEILNLLNLTEIRNKRCSELPLLAQRKVEIARAIMCHPSLILLDEPSAGANRKERHELVGVIERLRERGTGILVIEHNVPFISAISDTIWVLNFGKVVAHGSPQEIRANPSVQEIYMGG